MSVGWGDGAPMYVRQPRRPKAKNGGGRCTGPGNHGLDVRDAHARSLAGGNEHARVVEFVAVASEAGHDGIPHKGKSGSLKNSTADKVPSVVVVGIMAFKTDREAGSIGKSGELHGVELIFACDTHQLLGDVPRRLIHKPLMVPAGPTTPPLYALE